MYETMSVRVLQQGCRETVAWYRRLQAAIGSTIAALLWLERAAHAFPTALQDVGGKAMT
jgi:hypothetical protein